MGGQKQAIARQLNAFVVVDQTQPAKIVQEELNEHGAFGYVIVGTFQLLGGEPPQELRPYIVLMRPTGIELVGAGLVG